MNITVKQIKDIIEKGMSWYYKNRSEFSRNNSNTMSPMVQDNYKKKANLEISQIKKEVFQAYVDEIKKAEKLRSEAIKRCQALQDEYDSVKKFFSIGIPEVTETNIMQISNSANLEKDFTKNL